MKTKSRRAPKQSLRENLDAQLARLENAQLVRRDTAGEPTFSFRHTLTQEAAYEFMLEHLLRTRRARVSFPEALYLKAQALRGQNQFDQALAVLNEACAEAQAMGMRRTFWQILAAIGEIEAARGNKAEAHAARAQARQVIGYIAEHAPPELRGSFLALPEVRAVLDVQ